MPRAAMGLFLTACLCAAAPHSAAKHGERGDTRISRERDSGSSERSGPSVRERNGDSDRGGETVDRAGDDSSHGGGDSGRSSNSGPGSENSGKGSDNSGSGGGSDDDTETSLDDDNTNDSGNRRNILIVRDSRGDEYVDREVLVSVPDLAAAQSLLRAGYTVLSQDELPAAGLILIRVRGQSSSAESLDALRRSFPSASVSLNHIYRPNSGARSGGPALAEPLKAAGTVAVGLVDTRVDAAHPLLRNVRVVGANFEDGVPAAADHGTALASILGARQERVDLYSASVFTGTGGGGFGASAVSVARALNWLAGQNVQAINISLSGPPNPILESVIERLSGKGHVIVAAVGNDGPSRAVSYPAAYRDVVAVTAVDAGLAVYRYANRGPEVDFSALGVGLRAAAGGGGSQIVSGTSFAAPVVTLAIARAAQIKARTENGLASVRAAAIDLGAPGPDPVYGWGLVGESAGTGPVARSH